MPLNPAPRVLLAAFALLLLAGGSPLAAQAGASGPSPLERGLELYRAERYREALDQFSRLISAPEASPDKEEAAYWSALAYMASGETTQAERSIDSFLRLWPRSARVPDLLYQRGRLQYLKADYEGAIRTFASFVESAPRHEFVSAALYWGGECLYALGRLDEAERAFASLMEKYPKSVKVEAAGYRRELIKFEFRERELLKLLTWSHEESLRVVEDFRRRERSYEQALAAYQKQIADLKRGFPTETEKDVAELRAQLADLGSRYALLEGDLAAEKARLQAAQEESAALKAKLASAALAAPAAPSVPATADAAEAERLMAALLAKGRALDLLALYLQKLPGAGQ